MNNAPRMTRQHYEFIADVIVPQLASWPTEIAALADELAETNPRFNRDKFIKRATANWERANPVPEIDDEIIY